MDSVVWLIVVLASVGVLALAAGLFWAIHLKPRQRRRYERDHARQKMRAPQRGWS